MYKNLPLEAGNDYKASLTALKECFEPDSKQQLYFAEFQTRRRKQREGWADFGDVLRRLADRAFPTLTQEGREHLALNHYLAQLDEPQVAFSVKQKRPKSVDDAVSATLEMESYLQPKVAVCLAGGSEDTGSTGGENAAIAAVRTQQDTMMGMLQHLMDRMEKLENRPRWTPPRSRQRGGGVGGEQQEGRRAPVCWNCGQEGHFSRGCASRSNQGNSNPPP